MNTSGEAVSMGMVQQEPLDVVSGFAEAAAEPGLQVSLGLTLV